MSGGTFDYNQYKIRQIWEDIQQELDKQGKEKSKEDLDCPIIFLIAKLVVNLSNLLIK